MTTSRRHDPFAPHGGEGARRSRRARASAPKVATFADVRARFAAAGADDDVLASLDAAWDGLDAADQARQLAEFAALVAALVAAATPAEIDEAMTEAVAIMRQQLDDDVETGEQIGEATGVPLGEGVEALADGTVVALDADTWVVVGVAEAVEFDSDAESTSVEVDGHRKVVPAAAADAVTYIENAADSDEAQARAVAVARVELGRPANRRRQSVLAAVEAAKVEVVEP